ANLNTFHLIGFQTPVETILRKNQYLLSYGYPAALDYNQTTIPYNRFKTDEERTFAAYVTQVIGHRNIPQISPGLAKKLKENLLEIFSNSAMHSETEHGI